VIRHDGRTKERKPTTNSVTLVSFPCNYCTFEQDRDKKETETFVKN
jgi:hypothetical protein